MPYYYGYGFGIDPLYLLVVLVCTVLGLAAQNYINSTYKTWSKVRSDGDTGATVARRMLDANGCSAVGIKGVAGELTDHYNPQDNNLYLENSSQQVSARRLSSGADIGISSGRTLASGQTVQISSDACTGSNPRAMPPSVKAAMP